MKKEAHFLVLSVVVCGSALFAVRVGAESDPLAFLDKMAHDHDIPYVAPEGGLSRLSMLKELGAKYPMVDCTRYCRNAIPPQSEACRLGAFGAIYMQTARQQATGRDRLPNWEVQNASLNVQAYAYMKEYEAGIPCEESRFIKKFPTREPEPGEGSPAVTRLDACRAWRTYFEEAGFKRARHYEPAAETAPLGDRSYHEARAHNRRIEEIQRLAWRAHSISILGSFWDHYKELEYEAVKSSTPREEFKELMGFSRLVGGVIPVLNFSSCGNIDDVKHQVLPNCIKGTRDSSGKKCKGEPATNLKELLNQLGLAVFQEFWGTMDVDQVMKEFERGLFGSKGRNSRLHKSRD